MAADGRIVIETALDSSNVDSGLRQIENRVQKLGESIQSAGDSMTKAITVPLTAMGAAGIAAASSVSDAQTKIRNSLGLTKDEAEALTQTAKGIYSDGFGESLDDVSNALIQTKQNIKGLDEEDLANVTKSAMNLAQTFDADVNEVTRAGSNLMKGFGIDSEEAFDLMAHGAQNGLNFSNEMFDNLSEYAPLFGEMGFSASEYFQLLEQGSEAGVYNLDYINDAMKEFQIRVKDGSKSTSDAMGQMSESTQKVWKDFLAGKGTVKDVHNAVIAELKGMDDQVKANEIGVGLYGTKWEDLEADAMYALGNIDGGVKGVKGSMDEMNRVTEESFGTKWKQFTREALLALEPLGKVLLDFAMIVLPYVSQATKFVSDAFVGMDPVMQAVTVGIGLIVAAIGPFLTILGMMIGPITNVINALMKLRPMFTVIRTAMLALTGPVGIIIAVVTTLAIVIYQNWDQIRVWTIEKFTEVKNFLSNFFDLTERLFKIAVEFIKTTYTNGIQYVKVKSVEIFTSVKTFISNTFESIKTKISDTTERIRSTVSSKFQALRDAVSEKLKSAKEKVIGIWGEVHGFFEGIDLYSIGSNIIQGLIDGLWGKFSSLMSTTSEIANSITKKIKGALDIHSPSRVMMELGGFTTEGLEEGMLARSRNLEKAAEKIGNVAIDGVKESTLSGRSVSGSNSYYTDNSKYNVILEYKGGTGRTRQELLEMVDMIDRELERRKRINARAKGVILT
ncbi:phage tail tape measure protein [Bacillus sp. ISL-47]|uniref:phage tail tape measure protein n=1 Tax=Bacillus sp. ISL-47 TaxID=2819130 RepID=UPI001BEB0CFE|nr:phage tail tape measure protein [Bacillus sp. ISL-47]MBT2688256.1 phage tail tape measure protein [Bacillus sp. ISL-47]MBT2710049.1 phage tail tape measure protein [Pseudomonas sp. ISL-84]